jgi:hypothetical protein
MKNSKSALLMSVAVAALTVGVGAVSAQVPSSPAPAAQQSAPAEKVAPAQEPQGAAKTKAPEAGRTSGRIEDGPGRKSDRAPHAQDAQKDDMKSTGTNPEMKSPGKTSSDVKPGAKANSDVKPDAKSKSGMKTDTKMDKTTEKAGEPNASTTGQGAAGGSASLSAGQRTTVRAAVKQHNVQPMTNVNFSIAVGAEVPRSVRYHAVPVELVHIYPHWRGYEYFLVGDQIVVVNPRTHQIVAVLDA